jgi:tRNA(fMet)-specific endonuclease VapC
VRKILLDTNAYSSLRRGDEAVFEGICQAEILYMSAVVLGELQVGFRGGSRFNTNLRELRLFLDKPIVQLAYVTDDTAEVYGAVYHQLKRQGTPIPLNDVWIAAQSLELGAVLISRDRHFSHVKGLRIWPE